MISSQKRGLHSFTHLVRYFGRQIKFSWNKKFRHRKGSFDQSIQICEPNREGIVNYPTYKITENSHYINPGLLSDWQEIEDMISYTKIKERLLHQGVCENF